MAMKTESSRVGRAGEGAESHPVRHESEPAVEQQVKGRPMDKQAGEVGKSANPTAASTRAVSGDGGEGKPIYQAGEAGKTVPQTDGIGERAEDKPRQAEDSVSNEKVERSMELEPLQQILLALERQRTENAEREAARAKENAERDAARAREFAELRAENAERDAARARENAERETARAKENAERETARAKENAEREAARAKENAERDAARAREFAELRAENAGRDAARARENDEREAARAKENAERDVRWAREIAELCANFDRLRVENAELREELRTDNAELRADFIDRDAARAKETARGFQHMTMWFAGLSFGIITVVVAIVGVGIRLIE